MLDGDEPRQRVVASAPFPYEQIDVSTATEEARAARIATLLADFRVRDFDLTRAPLFRIALVRVSPTRHVHVVSCHHLVVDGWSWEVLMRDLWDAYVAERAGTPADVPPAPGVAAYVEWVRGQDLARAERTLRPRLAGFDTPTPVGARRAGPRDATTSPFARRDERRVVFGAELDAGVREAARTAGCSVAAVIAGAWGLTLGRAAGTTDVVFGLTLAGRHARVPDVERIVGVLVNTLPLRIPRFGGVGRDAWLGEIATRMHELLRWEATPLARVQEWSELGRATPLFETTLVVQNQISRRDQAALDARRGFTVRETEEGLGHDAIVLVVTPAARSIGVQLRYDASRLQGAEIERLLARFEEALRGIARGTAPEALDLATDGERAWLAERNRTVVTWPAGPATLHERFEAQVDRTPDAIAVVCGATRLTYAALDRRANALAARLRQAGVGVDARVALVTQRSAELLIAIYGILKAGGAYVPIDPGLPEARIRFLVEDAGATVVITDETIQDWTRAEAGRAPSGARADSLAYVIYTSGSTGTPKAAMNEHGAVVNRLLWMQAAYGLGAGDVVVQKTPYAFDVSVWELFWPLLVGARLVVARPEGHKDARYLAGLISAEQVTTIHFVPSMLSAFLEEPELGALPSLKRVICSGEALPAEVARRLRAQAPAAELHNLYGPTECAIDVSYWACPADVPPVIPIGRPIANTTLHVVDDGLAATLPGVAGELLIGGIAVGRGYLARPELTAERFLPDPFATTPGARVYRTGDLARWRDDGEIEYLGRIDHQVKVRGFRIELGEIEVALRAAGAVDAVVVLREEDDRTRRLVAYVTGADGDGLRAKIATTLPEYAVPPVIVRLDALPLGPNGKVDRRALPAPGRVERTFVAPEGEIEQTLAEVWAGVLGVERVGALDDFLALGGDSIRSILVASRARGRGLSVTSADVFGNPTVRALAAVARPTSGAAAAEQGALEGAWPVSPIVRWFLEDAPSDHFAQAVLLTPGARIEAGALGRALDAVVAHHDALRLRLRRADGTAWFAAVGPGQVPVATIDLSAERDVAGAIEREATAAHATLALETGPIARVVLFELGPARGQRILWTIHHVAVDAASWEILIADLAAALEGRALPPKTTSVRAWTQALEAEARRLEADPATWDRWSTAVPAPPARRSAPLEGPARRLVRRQAAIALRDARRPEEIVLAAVVDGTLARTGGDALIVDVEGHGRDPVDERAVDRTIGWFTTITPVVVARGATFDATVANAGAALVPVHAAPQAFGALRHLGTPASRARLDGWARASVLFNFLGAPFGAGATGLLAVAAEPTGLAEDPARRSRYLVSVMASRVDDALELELTSSWLDDAELAALADAIFAPLAGPFDAAAPTPADFPLAGLSPEELANLLRG